MISKDICSKNKLTVIYWFVKFQQNCSLLIFREQIPASGNKITT